MASGSSSRKKMLDDMQMDYTIIGHNSKEDRDISDMPIVEAVIALAQDKMESVDLGQIPANQKAYILTADTLIETTKEKQRIGKPRNFKHGHEMLSLISNQEILVASGCCLQIVKNGIIISTETFSGQATLEFCVQENEINTYLHTIPGILNACGAGQIEGFGAQYLKSINGSYSAVLGLPLFELREVLRKNGFFTF